MDRDGFGLRMLPKEYIKLMPRGRMKVKAASVVRVWFILSRLNLVAVVSCQIKSL